MFDYLITNGLLVDGSGAEPRSAAVGIKGDRIASIGSGDADARTVIDAQGAVVAPGFIDTHAHSEFTLLADGRAEGKISQGVTTEINGNCGLSAAPLYGAALERRTADLEEVGIKERWSTFREYFVLLEQRGIALNFATLCGHGTIRASVMGYRDEAPDERALAAMKRLLSEAVRDGAKGLSTGLIYPPGVYAGTEELIELSRTVAGHGIYASHMRSEGDRLVESIDEVIRIGSEAGIRVHISHVKTSGERNWGKIGAAIRRMEEARGRGLALTCDRYPYIAASTDLDTVLPAWVYEGGVEEELKRLADPGTAARIKAELSGKDDAYWKSVFVSSTVRPEHRWMEGESLFAVAAKRGMPVVDALFSILIEERVRTGAIFFSMNEDNLKRFLSLPYTMIGSDSSVRSLSGPTRIGMPHPRGFGSFPRFLGKYVRDEGVMGLPEAIRRITALPAATFGLSERGLVKEGYYADLAVFDYHSMKDTATFGSPYQLPEGVIHVFVNGEPVVHEGRMTGARPGRVLS
ncbi:MAG: D-aminoacylase [Nitrospirota bacterium]